MYHIRHFARLNKNSSVSSFSHEANGAVSSVYYVGLIFPVKQKVIGRTSHSSTMRNEYNKQDIEIVLEGKSHQDAKVWNKWTSFLKFHGFRQRKMDPSFHSEIFTDLPPCRQVRGEVISTAISDIPNESGVMAAAGEG